MNIIFLDVDGVLNISTPSPEHLRYDIELPGGTFTVNLNPAHGEQLLQLALDTDSELVWGSYWENNAATYIAPLIGLPWMPVMKIQKWKFSSFGGPDKAYSAKLYASGRKFVYFDDEYDLGTYLSPEFGENSGKHIYVDHVYGLLPRHLQTAKDYLINNVFPACVVCNTQNDEHEDYCSSVTVRL